MKKLTLVIGALALVAAACGGDTDDTTASPATSAAPTTAAPTTAVPTTAAPTTASPTTLVPTPTAVEVTLASSSLGEILSDGEGNILYLFVPDAQGPSVCNGDCAEAWPPIAEAQAGSGIDASLLGTVTRDDGTSQASYNGWPLYYFAGDSAPGDVNGQGVNDVWYVLDPAGNGVGLSGAAAGSVILSSSSLGEILTDQDGNTLYLFTPDNQGPSVCDGDCADAWPPLFEATAGDGIDASLLGTAPRGDGTEQVTYNGWPLYYFAADNAPGDTNGQGANDVWFVVDVVGNGVGI